MSGDIFVDDRPDALIRLLSAAVEGGVTDVALPSADALEIVRYVSDLETAVLMFGVVLQNLRNIMQMVEG